MLKISQYVEKALSGDMQAFEELYKISSQKVYFTCLSFTKNEADAEDLMQNTYIQAFKNLNSLKNPDKFINWISRIAVNISKNFLISKGKHFDESVDDDNNTIEENLTEEKFLPEEYITNEDKRKIIMDIISKNLSEVQYQTIIMFYFDEMTISEIAEVMECPEGTVKFRLNCARAKIKKGILEYEEKNDDKLHAFVGFPILTKLFDIQAQNTNIPNINLSSIIPKNAIQGAPNFQNKKTIDSIDKSKVMVNSMRNKIIAGVLVVGTIGGIVVFNNISSKKSKENENTSIASNNNYENVQNVETKDNKKQDDKNYEQAKEIVEKFLKALKEGDIETLAKVSGENTTFDSIVKQASDEGKEQLSQFFKQAFCNLNWDIESSKISNISTSFAKKSDSVNFLVNYTCNNYYMDGENFYIYNYIKDGEKINAPKLKSFEEGMDLLKKLQKVMPLGLQRSVPLKIDKDCKITVKINSWMEDIFTDDMDSHSLNKDGSFNPETIKKLLLKDMEYNSVEVKGNDYDYKEDGVKSNVTKEIVDKLTSFDDVALAQYVIDNKVMPMNSYLERYQKADKSILNKFKEDAKKNVKQIVVHTVNPKSNTHRATVVRYYNYNAQENDKKFADKYNAYVDSTHFYGNGSENYIENCMQTLYNYLVEMDE